jgi:exopolyphosphatase/guanosine-5'-triphosphate,3'-diphosphate pyrophosphatase
MERVVYIFKKPVFLITTAVLFLLLLVPLLTNVKPSELYSLITGKNHCYEIRYSFDIGSGATKTRKNLVDTCEGRLLKNLDEKIEQIKYQQCINNSKNGTLDPSCMKMGLDSIRRLQEKYNIDCSGEKCAGIATAWARNASNTEELIKAFREQNIHIRVVSQKEEGEIGFNAARMHTETKYFSPEHMIVWDIGGGSFQLSTGLNNEIYVYKGPYGIDNFGKKLRTHLEKRGMKIDYSNQFLPCVHTKEALKYAIKLVGKEAAKDELITGRIAAGNTRVFGIGRLLHLGIHKELGTEEVVTRKKIKELAYSFCDLDKEAIHKKYPNLPEHFIMSAQINVILAYGIMKGLNLSEMRVLDSKVADYVSEQPKYWNHRF